MRTIFLLVAVLCLVPCVQGYVRFTEALQTNSDGHLVMNIVLADCPDRILCYLEDGPPETDNGIATLTCPPGYSAEVHTDGTVNYNTNHGPFSFKATYDAGSPDSKSWACEYGCDDDDREFAHDTDPGWCLYYGSCLTNCY
jgi:hypothetical protein